MNCSNLKSLKLPEGFLKIGWQAFENCSNLTSVKIPDTLETIEEEAFKGCDNIHSIEINRGHEYFYQANAVVYNTETDEAVLRINEQYWSATVTKAILKAMKDSNKEL